MLHQRPLKRPYPPQPKHIPLYMPVTNAAKELYRLAMMKGYAHEDFSAIYEYLTGDDDFSTVNQKLGVPENTGLIKSSVKSGGE